MNKITNKMTNRIISGITNKNSVRFLCDNCLAETNQLNSLITIKSYSNCDTEKLNIFSFARTLKDKGVVYSWVNNVNNKRYIGSTTNLTARLYRYYSINHLLKHRNVISIALSKYGYSKFSFHILVVCGIDKCINIEQHYMDLLKPEYNMLKKAGSSLGFKHSEETLKFLREERKVSENTRRNLSLAASKRILSKQEKNKLSVSRLGKKMPLSTRTKISDSASELWGITVELKDTKSNTKEQFPSLTKAAERTGVSRTAVKKALVSGKLIKNRWTISQTGKN